MKTLLLVRHAHRSTSSPMADNGLSEKGEVQAELLKKYFKAHPLSAHPKKVRIFSSPKKRCRQTLEPLSHFLKADLDISPLLDEQGASESSASMQKRIVQFIQEWKKSSDQAWIACSHGDWLPLALDRLLGASISLNKGAFAEIHLNEEKGESGLSLHRLLQSLDSEA